MPKTAFTSIDEYILACPEGSQKYLREIRALIRSAAPEAREKISYQIAAFDREIAPYADGKGTVKFPLDKPLPLKLIRKIVKLHVAENIRKNKMKAGKGKY